MFNIARALLASSALTILIPICPVEAGSVPALAQSMEVDVEVEPPEARNPPRDAHGPHHSDAAAPKVAIDMAKDLPPEVLEKLNAAQLHELLVAKEHSRARINEAVARGPRGNEPMAEIMVPIVFFFSLVIIIGLGFFFGSRRDNQKHQTLRAMVEKGVEIPPELLVKSRRTDVDLRRGVVLIGAGFGLAVFLGVIEDAPSGLWACGLIPFLVGAGYLFAWWVQRREDKPAHT